MPSQMNDDSYDPYPRWFHPGRNTENLTGACGVYALAHALNRHPDQIYQYMGRDAAVPLSSGRTVPYLPNEFAEFLFVDRLPYRVIEFENPEEGVPHNELYARSEEGVADWLVSGYRCMLGLNMMTTRGLGHWIGSDGKTLNNLEILDGGPDTAILNDFYDRVSLSVNLHGELNGSLVSQEPFHVQWAILIGERVR